MVSGLGLRPFKETRSAQASQGQGPLWWPYKLMEKAVGGFSVLGGSGVVEVPPRP